MTASTADLAVDLATVEAARERIAPFLQKTPTLRSPIASARVEAEVFFKHETLQRTGSFKVRGGLNKILRLSESQRARGVVAASAGNHAQGVAFAAAQIGIPACIVMPKPTPQIKVDQTRSHGEGIEIVLHGETYDEAFAHAEALHQETGRALIHPFDDPDVIAGQGTIALELLDEVPDLDAVIIPVGGGGLIAGMATALRALRPAIEVWGVQTAAAPAMTRSFQQGERLHHPQARTLAEGIAVANPGVQTWPLIQANVDDMILVDEAAIERAIIRVLLEEKTLIEGAAAAGVAALYGPLAARVRGRKVAVLLCGANLDLSRLHLLVERALARRHRLVRLRATLADRPGTLVTFLASIAAEGGNVVRVIHDRVFGGARFGEAEVVVTLEVRNQAHLMAIAEALEASDHRVTEMDSEPGPSTL